MYYITFLSLLMLTIISFIKHDKMPYWVYLIPLTIVTYLRFGVGADYFSYEHLYNNSSIDSLTRLLTTNTNIEIGFKLLFLIGRKLGISYHTFITFLATIINFLLLKWVDDNEVNIGLATLLYYGLFYFAWTLNAIRQGIVMVVFCYFYFNPKYQLSWKKGIVISLILSFIHLSALILIPFIIALELKLSRKSIFATFLISLIITFMPIATVLSKLSNISLIAKASVYFDNVHRGFIDVPGITRIILFIGGWLLYNQILAYKNDENTRKMLDFYLLSFVLYFSLKSIELVAARLAVYGYFQIIILFPLLMQGIEKYEYKKIKKIAVCGFIVSFSALGVYKELNATILQSGYLKNTSDINRLTIYNAERRDFLNRYNQSKIYLEDSQKEYKEYITVKKLDEVTEATRNENIYMSVRFPNKKYGIIDVDGNVFIGPTYPKEMNVYGEWVELSPNNTPKDKYKYEHNQYKKIQEEEYLNEEKVFSIISPFIEKEITNKMTPIKRRAGTYEEAANSVALKNYFMKDIFDDIFVYDIKAEEPYKIMEFYVFERYYYIAFDKNNQPIIDAMFTRMEPFNDKGIMIAETSYTRQYINYKGEIIWMEKK